MLAAPLALPDAFPTPVFVRVVPEAEWREPVVFRVIVEAGGVVSVRLRWSESTAEIFVRRALVQGLLMRLAVAQHGVSERITAPLWLELACVGWWQTRADAAQLDAFKQETAQLAPPALAGLMGWQRGDAEPRDLMVGAVWLLTYLQGEASRAGEWPALLRRVLGGEAGLVALAGSFAGRFADERERELWWQVGWHQFRRGRTLPAMEARESRGVLAAAARFVFLDGAHEVVLPLREVLARENEAAVETAVRRHAAELDRVVSSLHPFYRNAGLTLTEALAARGGPRERREARWAAFEQDWRDATELEAASTAALDALERETKTSTNR
ncbi:MAG: hypothetical protein EXS32_12180 [Opitutus sp.]|nr:hypothetical protein [Opitutus sp.]